MSLALLEDNGGGRNKGLGLSILAQLEEHGYLTENSLNLPPGIPYEQYEALAFMFGHHHRRTQFVIGDLVNYGEKSYGETYAQAMELFGLAEQTVANYASVANRVPRSRRKYNVNFSVYAELASQEPDDQTKWLRLAEKNKWTRAKLRHELKGGGTIYVDVSDENVVEVVPAAIASEHLCQCQVCGRYHRNDVDIEL